MVERIKKTEAIAYLGISDRTIERYSKQGKLHPIYVPGPNGQEAYFDVEELKRFKEEKAMVTHTSEIVDGGLSVVDGGTEILLATIDKLLELLIERSHSSSSLTTYRELEEAAQKGWIVSTSTVKRLISTAPRGEEYVWGSFSFQRSAKVGREAGWRVVRL